MKREFNQSSKRIFFVFAAVIVLMIVGLVFLATRTANGATSKVNLAAGTVVYDSSYTPIELGSDGYIIKRSNGMFYLKENKTETLLGSHTLAYNGVTIKFFGGGYKVNSDGSVEAIVDGQDYTNSGLGSLFKLADRKYVLLGTTISDTNKVFEAKNYLYIVMDVVGNAKMFSNSMSLRTTQPTIVQSGNIYFDIANENVQIGDQVLDVGILMGSTNTFDPGVYKTIDEEQQSDVIDITIHGGNGGNGGSGGDGGNGANGGSGGDGGWGGDGGDGGMGEDKKTVQIVTINSVESQTSTTLTAYFSLLDPFGTLGVCFLELHKYDDLVVAGLSLADLYASELDDKAEYYWENGFVENGVRASISPYENSYTFTRLDADTKYYVVIGYEYNDETDGTGNTIKTKADYMIANTRAQKTTLKINYIARDEVSYTLNLESTSSANEGVIKMIGADDSVLYERKLTAADIKTGVLYGLTIVVPMEEEKLSKEETIMFTFNSTKVKNLMVKSYNEFYVEPEETK